MARNQKLKFRQQKRRKKTSQNQQNPGWVQIFFLSHFKRWQGSTYQGHTQNDMNRTLKQVKIQNMLRVKTTMTQTPTTKWTKKKSTKNKNEKIAHDFEKAA